MARAGDPGCVFCAGVEHATHVAEAIRERGVSCATIFGDTAHGRARSHHRRLQARRDQGARLDGRAHHRLQRAGGRSDRHAAPDQIRRPLRADGRPRHPPRARQGQLPGARLCRQRRPARPDRCRHAEARPAKARVPRPPRSARTATASCAAAVRECPDCGHRFPPPEVKVAATATTLAILSTMRPQWVAVSGVAYGRHEKPGKPPSLAGRLSLRARPPQRMDLLRAHRLRPPEGGRLVARAQHSAGAAHRRGRRWPSATRCRRPPRSRCARAAASPRSSITGSTHATPAASAPSAIANRGASAGSTPIFPSAIPDATQATASSAAASARTSVTGGAA